LATGFAGKGGSLYVPGTPNVPVASITNWSLSISADNYESTVLGDNWKQYIPGLRGWSGKATGFYNIVNDPTGQQALYNALLNGNSIAIQMQTGAVAGSGMWEGLTNITAVDVSDPVNNIVTIDFTFVGTGSLQHSP